MCLALSLTLALLALVPNAAGEDGKKFPKLIPSFDGDRESTSTKDASTVRPTAFQRVLDRVAPPMRIEKKPRGESALSKMNASTKRFFAKTKKTLTPWKSASAKPKPSQSSFLPFWAKRDPPTTKRTPFLPRFAKKDPEPKPATVPEWLGRPKP
jgi:hypothetical protein